MERERVADRGRAHHHRDRAGVQPFLGLLPSPHPSGDLDFDLDRLHDRAHDVPAVSLAARGVEIDNVEPLRPSFGVLAGDLDRVVRINLLAAEVPLGQPHRQPPADVDRGDDVHRSPRKVPDLGA